MTPFTTAGINGWRFAKHTGTCSQCDTAADPVATPANGVQLEVTTADLCDIGRKLLAVPDVSLPEEIN